MNSVPYKFGAQRNQDQRNKFGIMHTQTAAGLTEIVQTTENSNSGNNNISIVYQVLLTCQTLGEEGKTLLLAWTAYHFSFCFLFLKPYLASPKESTF